MLTGSSHQGGELLLWCQMLWSFRFFLVVISQEKDDGTLTPESSPSAPKCTNPHKERALKQPAEGGLYREPLSSHQPGGGYLHSAPKFKICVCALWEALLTKVICFAGESQPGNFTIKEHICRRQTVELWKMTDRLLLSGESAALSALYFLQHNKTNSLVEHKWSK